jgi:hypothetical protein
VIDAAVMSSARTGKGKDDWCTPAVVLDRVRLMGRIALDPCTSVVNPTDADDIFTGIGGASAYSCGLENDWHPHNGLVYCNPPYSKMTAWALKMVAEAKKGTPIITLVAARPDTKWWRSMWSVADAVALWRGRLKFVGAPSCAPFPSAVFGINVSQRRMRAVFGDVAEVVVP